MIQDVAVDAGNLKRAWYAALLRPVPRVQEYRSAPKRMDILVEPHDKALRRRFGERLVKNGNSTLRLEQALVNDWIAYTEDIEG